MTNEIKKIVIPIDFTKNNVNFLKAAMAIAKRHSANIYLINVIKSGLLGTGTAGSGKFYYHGNALLESSENLLAQVKNKLENGGCKHVETYATVGSVARSVTEYASEKSADLIVFGVDYPKKRPGFISSNAYEIITNTFVPVISVPYSCTKHEFQHMLYPVRDTEGVLSKLQSVLPIAKRNKSKISLLGIATGKINNSLLSVNNTIKFLKVKLARQNVEYVLQDVLIDENAEDRILQSCKSCNADLVAVNVTTEKPLAKIFQNNFTENIIYKSDIPVLFYRKKKPEDALAQFVTIPYPMFPV